MKKLLVLLMIVLVSTIVFLSRKMDLKEVIIPCHEGKGDLEVSKARFYYECWKGTPYLNAEKNEWLSFDDARRALERKNGGYSEIENEFVRKYENGRFGFGGMGCYHSWWRAHNSYHPSPRYALLVYQVIVAAVVAMLIILVLLLLAPLTQTSKALSESLGGIAFLIFIYFLSGPAAGFKHIFDAGDNWSGDLFLRGGYSSANLIFRIFKYAAGFGGITVIALFLLLKTLNTKDISDKDAFDSIDIANISGPKLFLSFICFAVFAVGLVLTVSVLMNFLGGYPPQGDFYP